ncbi:NADPH:quinone reductase [Ranunculus cassubicifolius]
MKAVVITTPGDPSVLQLQQVETPKIGDNEVLIKIVSTAVNGADTLQRQGKYPLPPGASSYPGLECSGTIEAVGKDVDRWKIGDQVHGGSSGIGTFAIQIAKYKGAKVFVTAGSDDKLATCKDLGADVCINYKTEDFVARVTEETGGKGVDVILDSIGGPYFQKNINSLAIDGRLFLLGFLGGPVAEVNLAFILARRLTVHGAGLRTRSLEKKAEIVEEVEKNVWPAIAEGKVKPVIYKAFPLSEAAQAHQLMETSNHIGKILLLA